MEQEEFTKDQAHLMFAKQLHGIVWDLLESPGRSSDDDEIMVQAAHASCYHWLQVGKAVNHQRAEWLIARVYTVLGKVDAALWHANRCLELTNSYAAEMEPFDAPFAYESVARANALAGKRSESIKYYR
jgi:hypothetical protein